MGLDRRRVFLSFIVILVVAGIGRLSFETVTAKSAVLQKSSPTVLYAGSVSVAEPLSFGSFDVALNLSQQDNTLTAQVDAARTMVYSGSPTLLGALGAAGSSGQPTFNLTASNVESNVTGRRIMRTVSFEGEFDQESDRLTGTYTETISGYTAHPITVKGTFLLVRSFATINVNPEPTPSPDPDPDTRFQIYLPLTRR
jgi:hypothetical protein